MSERRLIVGLGNPGKEYTNTRHNLGFLVVGHLAQKLKLSFQGSSFTKAMSATGEHDQREICCLLPLTFMNHSGVAVKEIMAKEEWSPQDILVVCDDINLDFGQIRLRARGSDGGHNGLASIISHLATEEFARLRLGVDSPKSGVDTTDYVLEEFKKKEKDELKDFTETAVDCCLLWLSEGTEKAMDQFNRRKD